MSEPFQFNPLDPHTRWNPWAAYARGRNEFPVLIHEGLPVPVASVFRYADIQEILRDPGTWSSEFAVRLGAEAGTLPPPGMIGTDPPTHTRLRSLINKAFTPRIIQRLEPRMREMADDLVRAAVEKGEVDLVEALTHPLPVNMIAEIIGVPSQDRAMFKVWSDQAVADLGVAFLSAEIDPESLQRQLDLRLAMRDYFVPLVEERRRNPQEDLLSGLALAEHEGSRLGHDEMISMLVLLLVAGNETTTTLIGDAAIELMAHPEQTKRLRDAPELLPTAIDEVLRFASPVQFDPRRSTKAVTIHGVEIPEDAFVLCWIGAANRDETIFEHPDVFDVGRTKNPHLAFGFGTHFCVGANLARLEARVSVEALLRHTSQFERLDDEELPLHPSPVFRGVTKLPVRLEAA